MDAQIRAKLTEFIVTNYLFGDIARVPRDDDSLVEEGIIDSTGILELIQFLESHFKIEISESEMAPENLGSISRLTEFIMRKLSMPVDEGVHDPGQDIATRECKESNWTACHQGVMNGRAVWPQH